MQKNYSASKLFKEQNIKFISDTINLLTHINPTKSLVHKCKVEHLLNKFKKYWIRTAEKDPSYSLKMEIIIKQIDNAIT